MGRVCTRPHTTRSVLHGAQVQASAPHHLVIVGPLVNENGRVPRSRGNSNDRLYFVNLDTPITTVYTIVIETTNNQNDLGDLTSELADKYYVQIYSNKL